VVKSFEMGMQERSLNKSDRVVGGGGVTNLSQDENSNENSLPEEKFFLESKLKVLFYLMGNKDEKK